MVSWKEFTRWLAMGVMVVAVMLSLTSAGASEQPSFGPRYVLPHFSPFVAAKPLFNATPATARLVSVRTVDMRTVPSATWQPPIGPRLVIPFRTGVNPYIYHRMKEAAAYNIHAPFNPRPINEFYNFSPLLPTITTSFQGMANSTAICPPNGCQPPDQAVAASSSFVMQGVNTSFKVYNTSGVAQSGWPKTGRAFFGVPNPGSCNPFGGAFLSDPRAFYDPVDNRFWVAMLQVDGAIIGDTCPDLTKYWIAVSGTSDPRGSWHIYSFDMSLGTTNAADFTEFGFDQHAIYFSGNMFSQTTGGFMYSELFGASKSNMESGLAVSAKGFKNLTVGGVPVDTVQPVETQQATGPGVELFANSFNMNFGGGLCSGGCTGIAVWAFANVLTTPSLTGKVISTTNYFLAPDANEPICVRCIESSDTRISGQPIFTGGNLYAALATGVFTGTSVVPGVFWFELHPTISGTTITGGSVVQSGLESFTGTRAATFGALMVDKNSNLLMVFDSMSSSLNPGTYITGRKPTDTLGTLEAPTTLQAGAAFTTDSRWGDYEAASYDGPTDNKVWVASQYSALTNDWATKVATFHL